MTSPLIPTDPPMAWCPLCERIVACDHNGKLYNHYLRGQATICPGTGANWATKTP